MLLLAAVAGNLWIKSDFFFTWNPLEANRRIYMSNPFLECPAIAEYLKAHTEPDDTIAVLGSEPEIFFDAQRHSATGYIYTYGLVEVQPLALQMQNWMIAEIEASKPKYVVLANVRCSWLTLPKSETAIFDWADDYLRNNYQVCGVFEPRSADGNGLFWVQTAPHVSDRREIPASGFTGSCFRIPNRRRCRSIACCRISRFTAGSRERGLRSVGLPAAERRNGVAWA